MNDTTADLAASTLTAKVWNLAGVLNNAGVGAGDYVEQVTYLMFLKLDEERAEDGQPSLIPTTCRWAVLADLSGGALARAYEELLKTLGAQPGLVGAVFARATNRIEEPAFLSRLVRLVGAEVWSRYGIDVKGAIYEGLLERTASDVKSGAGQYFTPRPLIQAVVEIVDPKPDQRVCDPACGTGGFLLAAYDHMRAHPVARDRDTARRMRRDGFTGYDIVPGVARLAAMNLYLHGLGNDMPGALSPIRRTDALLADPGDRWQLILTNPPFGRKQSIHVYTGDEAEAERDDYERQDFPETTGNKQLNFLQHCMTVLDEDGTAAMVVPDNVLYDSGAGERIRRRLLQEFDCHTLLRLPTGIFYRPGVKANVLFFERRPRRVLPWTEALWVYDLRTNQRFTLKERPLRRANLDEFVCLARLAGRSTRTEIPNVDRWKCYSYAELAARERFDLNLSWLKEDGAADPSTLPPPAEIAAGIVSELEAALAKFRAVAAKLAE